MNLFVYGTLMRANRPNETYLNDAAYLGRGTLQGYALYDLGPFPAIAMCAEGRVGGELYDISSLDIHDIDYYEGEGDLYIRKTVEVLREGGEACTAQTYVYNRSIVGYTQIPYEFHPWYQGIGERFKESEI